MKVDWKGSHFMVPFMLVVAVLRAQAASLSSLSFFAFAMFKETFDATLWTTL
jgi:hypothetical protein